MKGVSAETWIRTAVLLAALVNQALVTLGVSDRQADVDGWVRYASYILTCVSATWSWWKNNSFTEAAQDADKMLK